MVLYNGTDSAADMTVTLAQIGLRAGSATARDLWAHSDLGAFQDTFTTNVSPRHDAVALRVVGVEPPQPPAGTVFLSDLPWIRCANATGQSVDRDQSEQRLGRGTDQDSRHVVQQGHRRRRAVIGRVSSEKACLHHVPGHDRFSTTRPTARARSASRPGADGSKLFDSNEMQVAVLTGASDPVPVQVDVTGKQRLKLLVTNGGDGSDFDYADWADAQLDCM